MPYKCLNCGKVYEDNDPRVLKGCEACGGKMFVYIGPEPLEEKTSVSTQIKEVKLEPEGGEGEKVSITIRGPDKEIKIEGVETIVVEEPGRYLIDVDRLMKGHPIVLRMKKGDYRIYLPSLFGKPKKKV
ncbi:MAG: hypothetical protein J7J75_01790 [Euryarchaeota archaeon]|nr:hypothetical protein [Euryarchaeota archaeon]MCD6158356.1 hypothetical protein [Euryarchaeota archaeon]HHC18997.1 hypothetical protein [Euryarchaeota archaeon]